MLVGLLIVGGIVSFQRMPVDAYPDLAPPTVELITQWPGHAAEEVERLITLPLEVEMSASPSQIVVIGTGHWRGEGMALLETVR